MFPKAPPAGARSARMDRSGMSAADRKRRAQEEAEAIIRMGKKYQGKPLGELIQAIITGQAPMDAAAREALVAAAAKHQSEVGPIDRRSRNFIENTSLFLHENTPELYKEYTSLFYPGANVVSRLPITSIQTRLVPNNQLKAALSDPNVSDDDLENIVEQSRRYGVQNPDKAFTLAQILRTWFPRQG